MAGAAALGAPIPGGAWQGGVRTEEGTCYFGSCKALSLLSQKRTLALLCFLVVPVQQQGNAGAQTPAVVMQGSASAG